MGSKSSGLRLVWSMGVSAKHYDEYGSKSRALKSRARKSRGLKSIALTRADDLRAQHLLYYFSQ